MSKNIVRAAIALAVAITWCGSAMGQIQLVGEHLTNPSPPELAVIGQRPLVYLPVRTDSNVLYFTPFFVFENKSDGPLKVDVNEPLKQGDPWVVRLTLLVSPNWLLGSLATEVRKWASSPANDKYSRYKAIDAKSLIPTEFTYISVQQDDDNPLFKPVQRNDITTQQPIYLDAPLATKEQATELARKLADRRTSPRFSIKYRLYARVTVSETSVKVSGISVSQTEGVKSLLGAGKAFRASVSPEGGTTVVGEDRSVVTRDQKDAFAARVRNELAADYVIENPADLAFIEGKLKEYFGTMFHEKDIAFDQIAAEMKYLSNYSFSPGDLTPDKIQKLSVEAKNFLQTKDQSKVSFSGSGSASYMGFGGSASASYSRDELRERMVDKGWKFGVDGEFYTPKSLQVFIVNKKELANNFQIDISVSRRLREMTPFGAEVSTAQGFSDDSARRGYESLTGQNLALDIEKMSRAIADNSAALEDLRKLIGFLKSSHLKYKSIEQTLNRGVFATSPQNNQFTRVDIGNFGSKVIGVWWEPTNGVRGSTELVRAWTKWEGNMAWIEFARESNQGAFIAVRYHVLYIE
jgi:hypothetical protein